MENITKAMYDAMEDKAKRKTVINEGDYIGEDGLWYCGKCHTQKQVRIQVLDEERTPFCLCECANEKYRNTEKMIKEYQKRQRISENRRIGFPDREMQEWTFENDDLANEKITKAMKRYVEHFPEFFRGGKGLLLYGMPGGGKTYAACEVANALIDKGYSALVTNFARLTNVIQGRYDDRQDYIDSLQDYQLLVIDDLGVERRSEYMQEMVFNIIDSRYRQKLPMIITTNLTMQEIKNPNNLGDSRIYDRIIERCFPVEVAGGNRRKKAVRESYNDMKNMLGL